MKTTLIPFTATAFCAAALSLVPASVFAQTPAASAPNPATATASSDALAAPKTVTACRTLAAARLKAGDNDGAIAVLRQGLTLDTQDADLYAALAEAQAAKGQSADADRAWRTAVGDDPNQTWSSSRMLDGDLQFRYALWLAEQGRISESLQQYKAGLRSVVCRKPRAFAAEVVRERPEGRCSVPVHRGGEHSARDVLCRLRAE